MRSARLRPGGLVDPESPRTRSAPQSAGFAGRQAGLRRPRVNNPSGVPESARCAATVPKLRPTQILTRDPSRGERGAEAIEVIDGQVEIGDGQPDANRLPEMEAQ